jgi:hypothetical protein
MSTDLLLCDDAGGEGIVDGEGASSQGGEVHDAGDHALHKSARALLTVHENTCKNIKGMIFRGLCVCERESEGNPYEGGI